jgi:hypothetical protein
MVGGLYSVTALGENNQERLAFYAYYGVGRRPDFFIVGFGTFNFWLRARAKAESTCIVFWKAESWWALEWKERESRSAD